MKADLHIHSTTSDGSDSIEEIIQIAIEKGLDAIAITDHDTLSHIAKFPRNPKLKLIGGIEISAVDKSNNKRAHILGYNIQNPDLVTALTEPLLKARNRNSEKQAEILKRHGYMLDMDKLSRADDKYLYKQHILDWLVETGQITEMFGEFYNKTFKNGGACDVDIDYIDVSLAVRTIKKAGGIAVLAHPGRQQNYYLIPTLVRAGLDGLELNHHAHREQDRETIRRYAKEYNLFLTGGSDYHGKYEPRRIGDFLSEECSQFLTNMI